VLTVELTKVIWSVAVGAADVDPSVPPLTEPNPATGETASKAKSSLLLLRWMSNSNFEEIPA
jgi:hypothetical protein